ncbi:MAG: glycosyltransferase family 39 protein [Actinobacteria bacterium]|nr:glycosyltransferase family 39 protein [Actinomycetota bacterium]
MTQELTRKRTAISDGVPAEKASWHGLVLAAILILSAFLNLFRLTSAGYGNVYYAAAVKDMLTSWHNFFFVSFDAGFVSVDKPPLGLWIQAASAKLFGFHSLSLLLPQALAGILCVVDMLLVLTVLVAAWAVIHAAESGRLRWLLMGAVVVGLGFNIKMLEAFLVLPAFYLLYLVAAPVTWRRRIVHLSLATLVLVAVSLSWAVVVDLTPADQRPYVGSTSENTVMNLILGYNGVDRLVGTSFGAEGSMPAGTPGGPGLGVEQNGEPGPFRLLNQHYAGQIGWLLPLALVGLVAASGQDRLRLPLDRRHQALVLWGTWFFTMAAYFSVAGGQHRYYTVMLAPAVAALVGVGVMALWSDYRGPGREGWFLPLALVGMAALHALILSGYEGWSLRLTPVIVGSIIAE